MKLDRSALCRRCFYLRSLCRSRASDNPARAFESSPRRSPSRLLLQGREQVSTAPSDCWRALAAGCMGSSDQCFQRALTMSTVLRRRVEWPRSDRGSDSTASLEMSRTSNHRERCPQRFLAINRRCRSPSRLPLRVLSRGPHPTLGTARTWFKRRFAFIPGSQLYAKGPHDPLVILPQSGPIRRPSPATATPNLDA